jgi:hypothetical protein
LSTTGRQLKINVRIFVKKSSDFAQKIPLIKKGRGLSLVFFMGKSDVELNLGLLEARAV